MQLIIAEKPSVAQTIAKVLRVEERKDGYLEGTDYIVSWCIGHLVTLAAADAYDERYSRWQYQDLPILPQEWKFTVIPAVKKQFVILEKLMQDSRVDTVVCATDAGREGELIFRLVYQQCRCEKPVKRLWISSMEDNAIKKGFETMLDGENYDSLYVAALCRAKADWLVGINGTRLFSSLYHRTLNVGRVMTPTLSLIVEREQARKDFKKEKFYTLQALFQGFQAETDRITGKTEAEKQYTACLGKKFVVQKVTKQEKTERPPKLYDLTTLQRDANRLLGYTAQQTLEYAQSLYEKKLATYPRTDSRYLTEDMEAAIRVLCELLPNILPYSVVTTKDIHAAQVMNNKKVTDHHAIIPTRMMTKEKIDTLPAGERNIFYLLSTRLLCAVGEDFKKEEITAGLVCAEIPFLAKGENILREGWKEIEKEYQKTLRLEEKPDRLERKLPELLEEQAIEPVALSVKEGRTSPPKAYTEDTLLSAMERAGSEDFADLQAEQRGLGTPATRAGIIEKLVKGGYVERKQRQLFPTDKGKELVKVLPEKIKSAKLTAEWEYTLAKIEKGEESPEKFMDGIERFVVELVKSFEGLTVGMNPLAQRATVGVCPRCGKNVVEIQKGFVCENRQCGFAIWKNSPFFLNKKKMLTKKLANELLEKGKVYLTGLYSEKKQAFYDAMVVLHDTGQYVHYKLEFAEKRKTEKE